MKLFRHGSAGAEKPGAVDGQGILRDLSLLIEDWTPQWLAPERLGALKAIDLTKLPAVDPARRLGAPVAGSRQFVCVGLNYRQHALEAGLPLPSEPVVFNKALGCIAGPNDHVQLPAGSRHSDWEVELGFVIGSRAKDVSAERALDFVAGYFLANDLSERHWQMERQGQWTKGKSFDGFGPIGPWLVTADEVPDPQQLSLELKLNGVVKQRGSTADQIFPVAEVLAYISSFMTLLPGDLVITGTPAGVGLGEKPPRFLKAGDVMELEGGVLGRQRQQVSG